MRGHILPRLLTWQAVFLALLAGACLPRSLWFSLSAYGVLIVVQWKWSARHLFLTAAAFALGSGIMFFSLPRAVSMPSWAALGGKTVLAEGAVSSVSGIAGGRVRLLLEHVRPAVLPQDLDSETRKKLEKQLGRDDYEVALGLPKGYASVSERKKEIPGLVVLTLDSRALEYIDRPVTGQTVRGAIRFFPSGGSLNENVQDSRLYWHDRGVWCNARLSMSKNAPLWLEVSRGHGIRHWLESRRESLRKELAGKFGLESEEKTQVEDGGRSVLQPQAVPQSSAILIALLFGDRSLLAPRTAELFTQAGLVHSLALSGQHLALAGLFAAAFVWLASFCFRSMYIVMPRRIWTGLFSVPFALAYLYLGGAPFSLLRAACMMGIGVVFLCVRRTFTALDALFFAGAVLFFSWPLCVFDLSAQFSFLSVAGILCALPSVTDIHARLAPRSGQNVCMRVLKKTAQWAVTLILVSCAAQLAVMPVQIYVFGTAAPFFLLNLVWLPLLTFMTLPCAMLGLAAQTAGLAAFSSVLLWLAALPAEAVLRLLDLLDGIGVMPLVQCVRFSPQALLGAGVFLFSCFAFAGCACLKKKPVPSAWRMAACGLSLFFALGVLPAIGGSSGGRDCSVTLFDVGQAQSVLVECGNERVLVDGGGSSSPFFDCGKSILAPSLTYGKLPSLEAVAVTHTDTDHARGLRWILEHFSVKKMYWSPYSAGDSAGGEGLALKNAAEKNGIPVLEAYEGKHIPLPQGFDLEILWPPPLQADGGRTFSRNDASLVMRLVKDGKGLALLCGDVKTSALRILVKSGVDLKSDVLVLPHHGAASSYLPAFYDAVDPQIALASTGSYNQYGFPNKKITEELKKRKIPLLSTGKWGMLRVRWHKDGTVRTDIPFMR